MALPDRFKNATPTAISLVGAAIATALLDDLVYTQVITRESADRIIGNAKRELGSWSTQNVFGEARSLINLMQSELPKPD